MNDRVDPRTGEATTTHYGWTKPTVTASPDAWGGYLNNNLDMLDTTLWGIQAAQGNYLPLTGGTLTGSLTGTTASFAGGLMTIAANGNVTAGNVITANATVANPAGTPHYFASRSGTLNRWALMLGDGSAESGANAGANVAWQCYNDAGSAVIFTPMTIARATGVVSFQAAIVNGPSDATLKENVAPLTGSLAKIEALRGVSFNMIATPDKPEIGLIAQEVQPIVPEIIQSYAHTEEGRPAGSKLALDYPKLTVLLIEAVKELSARLAVLEGA